MKTTHWAKLNVAVQSPIKKVNSMAFEMCIVKPSDMIYDRKVDKLMDWERGVSNSKAKWEEFEDRREAWWEINNQREYTSPYVIIARKKSYMCIASFDSLKRHQRQDQCSNQGLEWFWSPASVFFSSSTRWANVSNSCSKPSLRSALQSKNEQSFDEFDFWCRRDLSGVRRGEVKETVVLFASLFAGWLSSFSRGKSAGRWRNLGFSLSSTRTIGRLDYLRWSNAALTARSS